MTINEPYTGNAAFSSVAFLACGIQITHLSYKR